jgi:hypothetical protein
VIQVNGRGLRTNIGDRDLAELQVAVNPISSRANGADRQLTGPTAAVVVARNKLASDFGGTPPQFIGAILIPIFSFALGLDAGLKCGAGWKDANRGSKLSRRATHLTARDSSAGPRKRRTADETDICRGRNVCTGGIAAFDCRPSIESRGYSITIGRRPPRMDSCQQARARASSRVAKD